MKSKKRNTFIAKFCPTFDRFNVTRIENAFSIQSIYTFYIPFLFDNIIIILAI